MRNTYEYPGVYIDEQPAANPIAGVGTSTAAFIGPVFNDRVQPNQPVFVTSPDQFRRQIDDRPRDGFYLWYAVRGFFENGGRRAYIVRASSVTFDDLELKDSRKKNAQTALVVRATQTGKASDTKVAVTHVDAPVGTVFALQAVVDQVLPGNDRISLKPSGGASPLSAEEVARQFRPGDKVTVSKGTDMEDRRISAVRDNLLVLDKKLEKDYKDGTVRLADLGVGDIEVRLDAGASVLSTGSLVEFKSGSDSAPIIEIVAIRGIVPELINAKPRTYRVTLESPLVKQFERKGKDITVTAKEFRIDVAKGDTKQSYEHLSMSRSHPRFAPAAIAAKQAALRGKQEPLVLITEPDIPSNAAGVERFPAATTKANLKDGDTDDPANLHLSHYQSAIDALRTVDDVNFIAIPDRTDTDVQLALLSHCENLKDRVAILDTPPGLKPMEAKLQVESVRSERGYSALYYPWIVVPHPDGKTIAVPPSGHVGGVYARADEEQGIHKAPANYSLRGQSLSSPPLTITLKRP